MIAWNDRRKAKKAASSEMKKNIAAMAKSGTLRATAKPSKDPFERARAKNELHYDIQDVKYEAQFGRSGRATYVGGADPSRKEALYRAAQRKDKGEI